MSPKTPDIANYFSAARRELELSDADAQIQRLKAEIEQLRNSQTSSPEVQLAQLREQLQERSGILSIPIDQIQPNQHQPRQTFLPTSVESMSRSLATDGQLEPIILIARENLVIFDGERRWRGAVQLGWETLQAVIIQEPEALHRKAMLTSLHREDLNALDKAEAIALEIATVAGLDFQKIPGVLARAMRRLKRQKQATALSALIALPEPEQQLGLVALSLDETETAVLGVLLDLQLNPASIDANIFPMLSTPDDLKQAIRERGLSGPAAIALQTLNAKNLGISESRARSARMKAIASVIDENLSVSDTRQLVATIRAKYGQSPGGRSRREVKQIRAIATDLQKLSPEVLDGAHPDQLVELQQVLQEKLAQIQSLLEPSERT